MPVWGEKSKPEIVAVYRVLVGLYVAKFVAAIALIMVGFRCLDSTVCPNDFILNGGYLGAGIGIFASSAITGLYALFVYSHVLGTGYKRYTIPYGIIKAVPVGILLIAAIICYSKEDTDYGVLLGVTIGMAVSSIISSGTAFIALVSYR